jgi:hypothetical protein
MGAVAQMSEAGGEFVIISYYNNKNKKQFAEITLKSLV